MRSPLSFLASLCLLAASAPAFAQEPPAPASPAPEAAPQASPQPAPEPAQPPPAPMPPPVVPPPPPAPAAAPAAPPSTMAAFLAKFAATLYGFIELDTIVDSTISFNEAAGNGNVAASGYNHENGRFQMSARHSRFGIRLKGPESEDIKTSAQFEMDFLGNQPAASESATFSNPTFRGRHLWGKLETPYVDVLFGQTWSLFGGSGYFHPSSVEIQGLPGQIFSRVAQLRFSHMVKMDDVNVELALGAMRPPQRNADAPDGQFSLKVLLPKWTAVHTLGAAGGPNADASGIGGSGVVRRFAVQQPVAMGQPASTSQVTATGWGISADLLMALIPGTAKERANAATLTGSFVYGRGLGDLYTGIANTPATGTDYDTGLIALDAMATLHTIQWTSVVAGVQYYLPPEGKAWLAANYGHMESNNDFANGAAASAVAYKESNFIDGCLFWSINAAARLGVEYAWFNQTLFNGTDTTNHRFQLSAFYIF